MLAYLMLAGALLVIAAYLFGSLPFMVVLAKARGLDLSQEKDLHHALWRKGGILGAVSAVLVDLGKGAIPVLVGFGFGLPLMAVGLSGVAATAGQMWPIFYRSHGEKGNIIGVAVIFALTLAYKAYFVLLCLIPMAIGAGMRFFFHLFSTEKPLGERIKFQKTPSTIALGLPVGMILGFGVAPLVSWCFQESREITLCLLFLFLLILLRRLTANLRADIKASNNIPKTVIDHLIFDGALGEREKEA